jgi:esterase
MSFLENFFYQLTGPDAAPKLVFLHGVMGFAANWRTIGKAFEDRFQVLAFDQRGHGRSFKPAVGYGPEDYAADLLKIIDELGWSRINLVGHSMGGRNALQFATEYPERVERLIIEDIGPSMNDAGASLILKILDSVPVPFPDKRAAKDFFATRFMEVFADHPQKEGLAAYLYANIIEDEQGRGVWRFYEAGVRESLAQGRVQERWDEIRELSMPTLLIRGEFSRDLPRDVFERILETNPRIRGVEIKGAGHWVHSDQPGRFIEALRRFLEST